MLFKFTQLVVLVVISSLLVHSQTPSNCFEIESILVDACVPGSPCTSAASPSCSCEGKNEMVRFRVGPNDLNLSSLTVNWPNNSWLGLCQNGTTASHVAAMNATVLNCGLFVEPVGGILPAGREVLLITSTDFCVSAHSFANLSDTIIVIFQCAGNWQGHFANYGTGTRTLTISFGAGCTDQVTYDRAQLLNQSLVPGAGDGALVNFAWDNTASYANNGCNAPLSPQVVNAGADVNACPGDVLTFTAIVQGSFSSYQWSGGAGTWTNANQLTATYQVGAGETGTIPITFTATNCNGNVTDQLLIQVTPNPQVSISPGGPINLCSGNNVNLLAGGIGNFVWSTGNTTSSITVNSPGTYTVTASNACGSSTAQVVVQNAGSAPVATISPASPVQLCQGNQVTLTAGGGTNYSWSTGETTASIQVNAAGNYTVTVSNACGSSTASVSVLVTLLPSISISPNGPIDLCAGNQVTLTASGTGNFLWNTGSTSSSINVNTPGTYTVTASNTCGSSSAQVVVQNGGSAPVASINPSGPIQLCQGSQVTLTASGGTNYSWNTNETTASIQVSSAGTYTVTVSNGCGSSTSSLSVSITPLPNVSITPNGPINICSGQQVALTANGTGSYQWNTGETSASITVSNSGFYTVVSSNACGSDTAIVQVINNGTLPTVSIQPGNSIQICQGQSVLITVSGADNYTWSNGQTSNSISLQSQGNYSVIGTNACGSDTAFFNVQVNDIPQITYTGNDTVLICSGQNTVLSVTSNSPLTWNTGNTGGNLSVSQPGFYYVYASNSCGADTVFIQVVASTVTANFTVNPTSGTVPLVVNTINNSSNATNFTWFMGDGTSYNSFQSTHQYSMPGIYNITLLAFNSVGCSDTAMISITVDSCDAQFYIPNTFTPNGDGINDLFEIKNPCIQSGLLYIYNRWGAEIFAAPISNQIMWDGRTNSNTEAVDGVYVYLIELIDYNSKNHIFRGVLHLFK